MKIFEIIDTEFTNNAPAPSSGEVVGTGVFSKVTKADDFTVNKQTAPASNIQWNPYYIYVATIAKLKLAEKNPYFPRVYSVNSGKVGKTYHPTYNIEQLTPITNLDDSVIVGLARAILNVNEKMLETHGAAELISIEIENAIDAPSEIKKTIKDPQLAEAIRIISKIYKKNDFELDLHAKNLMVRLTSVGPQLVITDPFYG